MIINDTDNQAESLLENWGNWCYINPDKLLDYSQQPMFRDYRAPNGEKPLPSTPVDEMDARIANAAILHIRIKEFPFDEIPRGLTRRGFFSVYDFLVLRHAHRVKVAEIAEMYGCSRTTIWKRSKRAKDEFIAEYLKIVRSMRKLNENSSVLG